MSCVLSLAFFIAVVMALSVADLELNVPTLKPPMWYEHATLCCNHELSIKDADEHYGDRRMLRECVRAYNGVQYPPCEPDLCFAINKGYASDYDDSIIKPVLQILLEVEFQNNVGTLNKILADCVYGDLNKYPERLCKIKKLNMCISVHVQEEVLRGCHDWKDHAYCLILRLRSGMTVKKYLNTTHAVPIGRKNASPTRTPSPHHRWSNRNRGYKH